MAPEHGTPDTPHTSGTYVTSYEDLNAPLDHVTAPGYIPESAHGSRSRIWVASVIVLLFLFGAVAFLMLSGNVGGNSLANDVSERGNSETQQQEELQPGTQQNPEEPTVPNPGSSDTDTNGAQPTPEEMKEQLSAFARRDANDPLSLGPVDAPVVIIEYADFTCPYCARFAQDTLPQIKKDYVEKGLVRLEWRDLPLFGDPSAAAAYGGRSAGEQGMFWEYQEALYAAEIPRDQVTKETVMQIAQSIGIPDLAKFEAGFTNESHYNAINRDFQEAQQLGVQSTPTFLINGEAIMGAESYENFARVIDAELAALGR